MWWRLLLLHGLIRHLLRRLLILRLLRRRHILWRQRPRCRGLLMLLRQLVRSSLFFPDLFAFARRLLHQLLLEVTLAPSGGNLHFRFRPQGSFSLPSGGALSSLCLVRAL